MLPRALIAEDNAALRTVIEFTVSKAGFETVATTNGREALQAALGSSFDLVISDHQMPQMSGLEFYQELRSHDRYKETPFVLLTAKRLELDTEQLKAELGVAEVLPKPFSPIKLTELLHELTAGVG